MALLALAISAAVWILVLRGEGGPVTKVTVDEPQSDTVDCTSPVLFRATVETNAEATVTYHWESNVGGNYAKAKLEFAKPAAQSIEETLQLTGSSGDEIKVTLVIDSPNSMRAARNHLTCR